MRYQLENNVLAVEIDSFGAEIKSIKRKTDGWNICGRQIQSSGDVLHRYYFRS